MAAMRLGVARTLLDDGRLVGGDVRIADGRIAAVGLHPPGRAGIAAPGFVDVQVNGFAGVDVTAAEPGDLDRLGRALAGRGVTAFAPTLISAPEADLVRALHAIGEAGATAGGIRVLGAHLEGPFLSAVWPGAHDPAHLRAPDRALLDRLLAAGPVALMTLAPELDGSPALIDALGPRALLGHTDGDAPTCTAAFARGARGLTHALNAHRRLLARDPGPAGAALAHDDAFVCAIADGVHVAPEALSLLWRAAGARLCLVSDAVATGTGGRAQVGGAARLADGTLAGSVVALDECVRALVACGAPVERALHAAATAPARLAGRPDLGRLAVGAPADVVVLDDNLHVVRTLVAGVEVS
jgi:N-acetylglucosamine-6-phosphate deacetylase